MILALRREKEHYVSIKTLKTFLVFQVFLLSLHRCKMLNYDETRSRDKESGRDDCRVGSEVVACR